MTERVNVQLVLPAPIAVACRVTFVKMAVPRTAMAHVLVLLDLPERIAHAKHVQKLVIQRALITAAVTTSAFANLTLRATCANTQT